MPAAKSHPGDQYLALVRTFPLRPIRTAADYDLALKVIDRLVDREVLTAEQEDYLAVLGRLVEDFETANDPLPPVSEADMLRHLIDSRGTTQAEVARVTGIAESTLSSILNGRRTLNRSHVETLARHFRVSPAVFLAVD